MIWSLVGRLYPSREIMLSSLIAMAKTSMQIMAFRYMSCGTHITHLINHGKNHQALQMFHQIQKNGQGITEHFLLAFVNSCGKIAAITEAKQAHCMILKHGFHTDVVLMTSLLNTYWKCTKIQEACQVFNEMPERDIIATNSMISGLCRCHLTRNAIELFNSMPLRDVGSWNSLISGLAHNLESRVALVYFEKMRLEGAEVDAVTLVCVLSVCSDIATLSNGRQAHGLAVKLGFESYLPVGNAIIDMYSKCGCVDYAYQCFQNMPFKNVVSWTSLIVGYGKHGQGIAALKAFDRMEIEGIIPNKITFLGTLYACSHAGLVQEGWKNFNTMVNKYSITPIMEHYTCMVDLLARAGRHKEAYNFIEEMELKPDARLLTALLSSCCSHMNVEIARSVGQKLIELEPDEAGAYMLLSNFYGLIGDLEGVSNVRRLMLERGIKKEKACTWIEINREVHHFVSGDRSHPHSNEIYDHFGVLLEKMKKAGYVPNISMVMQNVDERSKKEIILAHSEKLAITFGLIKTPPKSRIMIVKNLRMCTDCHVALGFISKIEGREIVARDSSRFHHYRNGVCSCGNHW